MSCNCNGSCGGSCDACSAVSNLKTRYPQLQTGIQTMANVNAASCGYRTIHIPAPTFPEKRKGPNGIYCVTPTGCDPDDPMGGWLTPVLLENIGAWTSGDPIEENVVFQLAYPGVISAVAFKLITANSNGALLTPARVRFGKLTTTKLRSVFPGFGAMTEGNGSVDLSDLNQQDPSDIMRPITDYSAQAVIDKINPLPLPMQLLDASGSNALWTATIDHRKTVAIDILIDLYISYNALAAD
jgi:hypothetical protein